MAWLDRLTARLFALARRLRTIERREALELRRWVESTNNFIHVSILLFVPLLLALVTWLSNMVSVLPYLLFPPLASGTYTLFAHPESEYASPRRFVGGLTVGAICGYVAYRVGVTLGPGPQAAFHVNPGGAALAIFLTGVVTWAFDLEEASAFSSSLLVQVIDVSESAVLDLVVAPGMVLALSPRSAYVISVFVSSSVVAGGFLLWREEFYEERASYLYGTTSGDDHVLVPVRGDDVRETATLAARLASAHEAGKVVLLDVLDEEQLPEDVDCPNGDLTPRDLPAGLAETVEARVDELGGYADELRTRVGVPVEVVVAAGPPGQTAIDTAERTNCDLVVTPYEEEHGSLSGFVRTIFRGPVDAVAFKSAGERRRWRRVMVPIARPGNTAHAMVDFASRLAGQSGDVTVCTCIDREIERRPAQRRLADIVEAFTGPIETHVAREEITEFIAEEAGNQDLVIIGSSGERSAASRFISPPTFERLRDVDCDVAVFDRGWGK